MGDALTDRSVQWAIRAMDWCVRRQRLITSNIVNRDTPGYRSVDVEFKRLMERIDKGGEGPVLECTDPGHLPGLSGYPPRILTVKQVAERPDGNTVNLSEEMAHLVENNFLYQALLKHVSRKFQALKLAINGG